MRAAPHYRDIVAALDPFVDLWIGETFSCVDELHVVADAVSTAGSGQSLWIAFSFPDEWAAGLGVALRSGETPADIASAVASRHGEIAAILVNCTTPEQTGPALGALLVGWLAELFGLRPALAIAAGLAFVVVLSVLPVLRRRATEMEADPT